jgi:riboflavin kinase/FMN adenylyltransferase
MAIATLAWAETPLPGVRAGAIAIGNFDGVHRGHLALLAELRAGAQRIGGPAVAVTFDPHPLQLLRPEQFQPLLTPIRDRAALLEAHGADHVVILRTTPELLQLSAVEFFDQLVRRGLEARLQVEGPNFGFGHNREGNIETLAELCRQAGMELVIVPPLKWQGALVASSRVRRALISGGVADAAELLGRPYRLRGTVGEGAGRGRTLGFPTANLQQPEMLVPGDGVYAVRVHHQDVAWPGAVNIGPNPTFAEQARKIEVHLIGFQGNLRGEVLSLDFIDRLRDTRAFHGPADLVAQLQRDVERARQLVQGSGDKEGS